MRETFCKGVTLVRYVFRSYSHDVGHSKAQFGGDLICSSTADSAVRKTKELCSVAPSKALAMLSPRRLC